MHDLEIWVCVGSSGDYAVGATEEASIEAFEESIGGNEARRTISIMAKVELPKPQVITLATPIMAPHEDATAELV